MPLLRLVLPLLVLTLFSANTYAESREAKAWELIEQGALLVDVRTTQEYAQGHLKNSLHIAYPEIVDRFNQMEIRKDLPVVLYCRSGNRSGIAYQMLTDAGYTVLHNGGGLNDLLKAAPR